jgi:DNA-binding NarL/FixJ family response regulator
MSYRKKVFIAVQGDIFKSGLTKQFGEWGFEVVELINCHTITLEEIKNQQPTLIIMDIESIQEQAELAAQILSNSHTIPVINLIPGIQVPEQQELSLQRIRRNYFLPKPCRVAYLQKVVEFILKGPLTPHPSQEKVTL